MKTQLMKHTWPQGYLNMLFCSVFVFGAVFAFNWLVMIVTKRSLLESTGIAFAMMFTIVMVCYLWSWIYGLKNCGEILLDCGYHPIRKQCHVHAAVFFAIGVVVSLLRLDDPLLRWSALFGIAIAAFWLSMGQGRLSIHENGVWSYWGFLKWNRIKKYSWADDGSLIVKMTGPIWAMRGGVIVMQPEHAEEFRHMFEQRIQ